MIKLKTALSGKDLWVILDKVQCVVGPKGGSSCWGLYLIGTVKGEFGWVITEEDAMRVLDALRAREGEV